MVSRLTVNTVPWWHVLIYKSMALTGWPWPWEPSCTFMSVVLRAHQDTSIYIRSGGSEYGNRNTKKLFK